MAVILKLFHVQDTLTLVDKHICWRCFCYNRSVIRQYVHCIFSYFCDFWNVSSTSLSLTFYII